MKRQAPQTPPHYARDTTEEQGAAIFLTTVDLSLPSACSVHVAAIAHGLAKQGRAVIVVAPGLLNGVEPGVSLAADGVTVRWTYPINGWRLPRTLNILPMLLDLIRWMRHQPVRLAYVRFSPLTPVLVWLVRKLIPDAIVVTEHNGWVASEASMGGWPTWLCRVVVWLQALDGRLAHAVRAVTDDVRDCLVEAGVPAHKVFVAENGTNLDHFRPLDRAQSKAEAGLDLSHVHVGFLGTLTPWQGVDVLLRAASLLTERHPELRLVIGGAGGGANVYHALAKKLQLTDKVTFLGWVPADRANTVVNAFDIAVAPYHLPPARPIGSPVKLRDYAAAGRPVVAADYPVIAHVSDESWCLRHRPGDHVHLAEHLEELLTDPARRDAMGAAARHHAERSFGWASVIDAITSHLPNTDR